MKPLFILFALSLLPGPAYAAGPIEFQARIQREDLAEEAIDFLHCLSLRFELPWQLGEGGRAPHRLRLDEKDGLLQGSWVTPKGERPVSFGMGEAEAACTALAPEEAPKPETLPDLPPPSSGAKKSWGWFAATAVILAGGYLLWKSRQPDHRSLRME